MRRSVHHESILIRYLSSLSAYHCLSPKIFLNFLNFCFFFTFILFVLFLISLCLTFLLFINVTQLKIFNDLQIIEPNFIPKEWNTFIEPLKHQRRSKVVLKSDISKILENQNIFKFQILQNASESRQNCSNFNLSDDKSQNIINLVIIIHSACNHSTSRKSMREQINISTLFSTYQISISHLFVLGTTQNNTLMNDIVDESNQYGDILQLDFKDTYRNLTLKHLSSLRWPLENCMKASIILKLDDDAFIDLRALLSAISSMPYKNNLLACSFFPDKTSPKRGKGKWSLSLEEYPFETYPSYCSGVGYLLTPDVAFDLLDAFQQRFSLIPIIGIDDVFITGMIRSLLDPQPMIMRLNDRFEYKEYRMRNWLNDLQNNCPSGVIIADIGDQSDRESLSQKLLNKTNYLWKNFNFPKCNKFHTKISRLNL